MSSASQPTAAVGIGSANREKEERRRHGFRWWHAAIVVVILGGLFGLSFLIPLKAWLATAVSWIDDLGFWGPLAFGAIYMAAILVGLPSTPFNIAAGLVFGVLVGATTTVAAGTLGGLAGFLLARYMLGDWVQKKLEYHPKAKRVFEACEDSPWTFLVLLRVHPLLPSTLKNYGLGTTGVRWWQFAITTAIAGAPLRILYAYFGSIGHMSLTTTEDNAMKASDWISFGVGTFVALALTVGLSWYAKRRLSAFERKQHRVPRLRASTTN